MDSSSYNYSSDHHHHPHLRVAGNQAPASYQRFPMKKSIAPLPPTLPKVYKVDPVDFKDVVQKLTGAPEFMPRRLQEVAPPPLDLFPEPAVGLSPAQTMSPLGFSLSPASMAWCSSVLMSPGTMASLDPSPLV